MARHVGAEIWKRYQVPVYLYEAAATTPERQNLENIRRGQFEGVRDEIASNPARMPDFGKARLHPTAGATVVGARKFLIAYNIFLNTPDVDVAKKHRQGSALFLGRDALRESIGFPGARLGAGFNEPDRFRADAGASRVRAREARGRALGVLPVSSEIAGLIPKRAVEQAAEWFLQLENFDSSLILENRLAAVVSGKMAVGGFRAGIEPFIEQLATPAAVPGGGSAAAAGAAMAAGWPAWLLRCRAVRRRTRNTRAS